VGQVIEKLPLVGRNRHCLLGQPDSRVEVVGPHALPRQEVDDDGVVADGG
jgi:hypothetical protein